jgi:hypothetical protein
MQTVSLSNLSWFNSKQIAALNHFVKVNTSLTPHAIAVATGCRHEEAMALLLFLYGKSIVTGYLLVYHKAHPDFYIEKRELMEGLPRSGYTCSVCDGEEVEDADLLFDFEFSLNTDTQFEGAKNNVI